MRTLFDKSRRLCPFLALILILHPVIISMASAQDTLSIKNVRFETRSDKVVVYYDLVGSRDREYKVSVVLKKESKPAFMYIPKALRGDVGIVRAAGDNKQITWNLVREFPDGLEGSDYFFQIDVEEVASSDLTLLWIGAGIALLGGGAALLLSSSKAGPTDNGSFPLPPGRP